MIRVLFICLGNICRSPIAEGVFSRLVCDRGLSEAFEIASASTGDYHTGEHPDPRAVRAAMRAGIDISGHVARRVTREDFDRFDYVLGMDAMNMRDLARIRPSGSKARVAYFTSFSQGAMPEEIEDPWYGDESGFDATVRSARQASEAFLTHLAAAGKL